MRRVLVGVALLLTTTALAQTPPAQIRPQAPTIQAPIRPTLQNYAYTARTAAPVRRSGQVTAGGITWTCAQQQCTVTGPWPAPGVSSCQALSREVGRITAYGHPNAQLTAAQLTQCNAPTASPAPALPPPPPDPGAIRTPEVFLVGGVESGIAPDRPPVSITTPEAVLVGGADAGVAPDRPPVSLTTPEVSLVGR